MKRILLFTLACLLLLWGSVALVLLLAALYGLYPLATVFLMTVLVCLLFAVLHETDRGSGCGLMSRSDIPPPPPPRRRQPYPPQTKDPM